MLFNINPINPSIHQSINLSFYYLPHLTPTPPPRGSLEPQSKIYCCNCYVLGHRCSQHHYRAPRLVPLVPLTSRLAALALDSPMAGNRKLIARLKNLMVQGLNTVSSTLVRIKMTVRELLRPDHGSSYPADRIHQSNANILGSKHY
jgi:hypothetical protein